MASLDATESGLLALACGDSALFYDTATKRSLGQVRANDFLQASSGSSISVARFSSRGSMYAFSRGKRLTLISVPGLEPIDSWELAKSAARIAFPADDSRVIVADKAGDVRTYPTGRGDSGGGGGDLLLGHLSVLLDVLTTADIGHIITSDRDEKIRVSRYPNSYNVVGYCLGHEEFVSSIALVPHDADLLVSCSGDGTIRFWRYSTCVQLAIVHCRRSALTDCLPIRLDSKSSLLAVLCSEFSGVLVYSVGGTTALECALVQTIRTPARPRRLASVGTTLWVLSNDDNSYLASFDWDDGRRAFEETTAAEQAMSALSEYEIGRRLEAAFESETPIDALYKRKFDNVQEYLEKKTARLDGKTGKPAKKIKTEDLT